MFSVLIAAAALCGLLGGVAAWRLSTPAERDRLALQFAVGVVTPQAVVGARLDDEAAMRGLFVYRVVRGEMVRDEAPGTIPEGEHRVRFVGGALSVLAPSRELAARAFLGADGQVASVDCMLADVRIVRQGDGSWAAVVLPRWLAPLGRRCEHDPREHAGE